MNIEDPRDTAERRGISFHTQWFARIRQSPWSAVCIMGVFLLVIHLTYTWRLSVALHLGHDEQCICHKWLLLLLLQLYLSNAESLQWSSLQIRAAGQKAVCLYLHLRSCSALSPGTLNHSLLATHSGTDYAVLQLEHAALKWKRLSAASNHFPGTEEVLTGGPRDFVATLNLEQLRDRLRPLKVPS